jgi:class 3 adenylate cyclase/tetratricopeptide (TPR) repeat protein
MQGPGYACSVKCPGCSAGVPAGSRFCPSCGGQLTAPASPEERKLVSILFVDQVGSTARADGADPEDIRDLNRIYYEETRARIERHGGMIEKYAGDAVMAVFGAPLAGSNDAENAVRSGLSVLDGIRELNARNPGLDLAVRVGICTGEAMVEIDPAPGSSIATGDVVNTAARLQASAPSGGMIVGPETYRLTRHAFRYRASSPLTVKGKREPIPAWVVEGAVTPMVAGAWPQTPLIGRNSELLLLRTAWARAVEENQPQLISLIGPAGIGKSRLAREISAEVEACGGRALWGRCLAHEQRSPYHAIAGIVRATAAIFESDEVEKAREKLSSFLASRFPDDEAPSMTRYLSLLLGLGLDQRALKSIDIHYTVRRLFERLSEETPVLVVFDDLHWADDASLELLSYISTHTRDRPVMMMGLARSELLGSRPLWRTGAATQTVLPLNPLNAQEARQAVSGLLPDAAKATVERVVATADGNPLFIEELVASIQDETSTGDLPPTVRAVIAARIDALPADARSALLRASVIGRFFWRGVLERIGGVVDIDVALDALEMRGLVQRRLPSRIEGDSEFSFKHDLVLEGAYSTLPRATRRELHARTAAVLEGLAKQPEEIASILAHHWLQGGDPSSARRYLLTAAARALDALAGAETYDLYTKALELTEDEPEAIAVRFLRASALVELEDYARAANELAELIPALDGRQKVEALIAHARSSLWTEQTDATMASATLALDLARQGGLADLEALAVGLVGGAHGMRGEAGDLALALRLGDQALEGWAPNTHRAELAEHYHLAANHYYWAGEYDRSMEACQLSAVTAGVDLRSREFRLRGAGMQGIILAALGRYEEAIAATEYAIGLAREIGRPTNVVMNYSTLPLREIFALDEASARSEEVTAGLGPSDFNMPWMNARADLFTAKVMKGDISGAERDWGQLWDDALSSRAWERWLITGRLAAVRAELELGAGRPGEAQAWAQRAVDMAVASSRRKYEAIGRALLGRALLNDGRKEEAVSELRQAVDVADGLGSPSIRWQSRAALARALAASRRDPTSPYVQAVEIVRAVATGLTPEHAAGFLAAPDVAELLTTSQFPSPAPAAVSSRRSPRRTASGAPP